MSSNTEDLIHVVLREDAEQYHENRADEYGTGGLERHARDVVYGERERDEERERSGDYCVHVWQTHVVLLFDIHSDSRRVLPAARRGCGRRGAVLRRNRDVLLADGWANNRRRGFRQAEKS